MEKKALIIAVVGSGGKTTYIHEQAMAYRAQGKRVLVTTTTHMYEEPDTLVTNDAKEICTCLQEKGYCMAGQRAQEGKIAALSPEVLARAAQCADIVLVEADGSRGLPVKLPAAHEPVIPDGVDEIVVVMGFFAVGRTIEEVCHRPQLVCRCLGEPLSHHLTEEDLQKLVEEGYRKPLQRRYPNVSIKLKKLL